MHGPIQCESPARRGPHIELKPEPRRPGRSRTRPGRLQCVLPQNHHLAETATRELLASRGLA